MSSIIIRYMPEFVDDFNKYTDHDKKIIRAAIEKLSSNPVSVREGGYGNVVSKNETGSVMCVKIIFTGIRIIYKLMNSADSMLLIFVSVSNDNIQSAL